jgi:hypothetical protein
MKKHHYVYALMDPRSQKVFYIGKGVRYRAWVHLRENVRTNHNPFLYRRIESIRRDGFEPEVRILCRHDTHESAISQEIELIALYGKASQGGILTNLTDGGQGTPGYRYTPEQRSAVQERMIGTKQSTETRRKRSVKLTGISRSAETRRLMSESKKGAQNAMFGKETWMKGKTHCDESKRKIKSARAKQTISDETRIKMSETHKRIWAERRSGKEV